jgi:putative endonuclease
MVNPSADGLLSRMLMNSNMFRVYVIKNNENKIYIGYTSDLEKRLLRHNGVLNRKKKSFTYKNKGPWRVVCTETFDKITEATRREKELKSSRGRDFIKGLLDK